MPVLIVQAANDPFISSQNIARLTAETQNPQVATIVLPGGGHVGFAPYAKDYFYSLLLNFFSPQRGPAASAVERASVVGVRTGDGVQRGPGNGSPVR